MYIFLYVMDTMEIFLQSCSTRLIPVLSVTSFDYIIQSWYNLFYLTFYKVYFSSLIFRSSFVEIVRWYHKSTVSYLSTSINDEYIFNI